MNQRQAEIMQIIERHYDTIFAFSVRALGCRQEAEDLAQDVCLSLAEKLPEYRGEAKLTSWLFRIVINAARDRMRKTGRFAAACSEWGSREIAERGDQDEQAGRAEFLKDAMSHLDPTQRITLALVVTEGFSQAEVAEILEVAPGTVAWRMNEIKKRLAALAGEAEQVA